MLARRLVGKRGLQAIARITMPEMSVRLRIITRAQITARPNLLAGAGGDASSLNEKLTHSLGETQQPPPSSPPPSDPPLPLSRAPQLSMHVTR